MAVSSKLSVIILEPSVINNNINMILNKIQWFFGLLICLLGFSKLTNNNILFGIFLLIIGAIILPPIRKIIFKPKPNNPEKLVSVTSKSIDESTTEVTIELNQDEFLKRLNNGSLTSKNHEQSIEDITGFYGNKKYSENKEYCIQFRDGHEENGKWKNGQLALLKNNILQYKKTIARPHDCIVTNEGIVICTDWLNTTSLAGKFLILNSIGEEIFSKKTTANIGNLAVSKDSKIAIFETHSSESNDGDKIFVIDTEKKELHKKFDKIVSFKKASIKNDINRIKLQDYRGFKIEIDFDGIQTNEEDYENQVLKKGTIQDKLYLYQGKPDTEKFSDINYLNLLNNALNDKDANYSFGLDHLYRKLGEYYESNHQIEKTIESWEKAIELNPKVGIKRKLDVMRNKL